MTCAYCGTNNESSDHRCYRCGRRLSHAVAQAAADVYPVSSTAAVPVPTARSGMAGLARRVVSAAPPQEAVQQGLFTSRELGQVVPIAAYQPAVIAPGQPAAPPKPVREPVKTPRVIRAERAAVSASAAPSGAAIVRGGHPLTPAAPAHEAAQQTFEFRPAPAPATLSSDSKRNRRAPVAVPLHRVLAASLDLSLIMIGVGIVVSILYFQAEAEFAGRNIIAFLAVLGAVLGVGYKLLFALANTDSPGMSWTNLRLLNFDGVPPSRRERLVRIAWSLVSVLPAGLGLLWALADEERLSWHDHTSKTFLTPFTNRAARTS